MYYLAAVSLMFIITHGQASIGSTIWENLPKDCGKTRFDKQNKKGRVINGDEAKLGQFPWMARLGTKYKNGDIHFDCGGTLISKDFVISAAHCETGMNIVRLGQTYVADGAECDGIHGRGDCAPPYQDIKIKRYIMFGEFNATNFRYDIILYELDKPAELNDYVQPVCLPQVQLSKSELVGEDIIIAGWGRQNGTEKKSYPKHLMYIVVPVLDPKWCSRMFRYFNCTSQFCIDRPNDKGLCAGDSGSGAVKYMKVDGERRAYLIGIVSYGKGDCARSTVFTFVQHYLKTSCEN